MQNGTIAVFVYWPSGCTGHCGLLSRRVYRPHGGYGDNSKIIGDLTPSLRHPVSTGQRGVSTRHRDGVTSSCFRSKNLYGDCSFLSGFSRPPSAHSRSECGTESTMEMASPSFTGVLPVALRNRVCGMATDSVWISSSQQCCIRAVVARREEFWACSTVQGLNRQSVAWRTL